MFRWKRRTNGFKNQTSVDAPNCQKISLYLYSESRQQVSNFVIGDSAIAFVVKCNLRSGHLSQLESYGNIAPMPNL